MDNLGSQIRVNTVCPAWTDTPMMEAAFKRNQQAGEMIKALSPLGRMAHAEEVADAIIFLCSPSASYINGASLIIDAGLTLTARGTSHL